MGRYREWNGTVEDRINTSTQDTSCFQAADQTE